MECVKRRRKYDCGQCCVAMLTGVTYEEAVGAVGHINSTKTKELIAAINKLGWQVTGSRLIPFTQHIGVLDLKHALVKVSWRRGGWHWVAVHDGEIYDPSYRRLALAVGRCTSFLNVWR